MRNATLLLVMSTFCDIITIMDAECEEKEAHIERDRERIRVLEDEVAEGRVKMERLVERYDSTVGTLQNELDAKSAQVRQLRTANLKLMYGGQTPEETARTYMNNHGAAVWEENKPGERVSVVLKTVREITEWDLHRAVEWVNAYMKGESEKVEDSGPQTKRSFPSPPGVGANAPVIQVSA